MRRRRLLVPALLLVAVAVAVLVIVSRGGGEPDGPLVPAPAGDAAAVGDPFAWTPERSDAFVQRTVAGAAHPLFVRSPGGVIATAKRVQRYRKPIERAARTAGVDPNRLEALVFLESAGRATALAPGGIESAAGLTQILAETATSLLGMKVDLARSRDYTRRLDRAVREGNLPRAAALSRARRRVDDRFDPAKALAGTARYLRLARERFGRQDLAFVSYHMGMGNLENVLEDFGDGRVPYAELYFDSTPLSHAAAYRRLAGFGDESSTYYWKLGSAIELMRLWRQDRPRLEALARLQTAAGSAREVLLDDAPRGGLRDVDGDPARTGLRVADDVRLRPEAAAIALYIGAWVRRITGGTAALRVTGVGDGGWTFRVSRTYASDAQAQAFQFVLDRLSLLGVIAWERTERSIVVTGSVDGRALEGLLARAR